MILRFRPKIRLNFGEDLFFGDHLFLGGKTVSISDKLFESDSKAMKIRVKIAYSCLTLSKSPSFFEILATRLVLQHFFIIVFYGCLKQKAHQVRIKPKFYQP